MKTGALSFIKKEKSLQTELAHSNTKPTNQSFQNKVTNT